MISRLNIFFCVLLLLTACGQEPTTEETNSTEPTNQSINAEEQIVSEEIITLAPPVRDAEQDSVDQHMSDVSPFLNEGCCLEEMEREKPCCCESVFEQYQRMIQAEESQVAELSMTDPILADCRRLMPKKFDALENPPTDETDEELF